jgi:hypothetical protein
MNQKINTYSISIRGKNGGGQYLLNYWILLLAALPYEWQQHSTVEVSFRTGYIIPQPIWKSKLLFNVVLEVIVRPANLQTTGTIYNKETQLLAYADDINIIGRSRQRNRVPTILDDTNE